MQLQNFFKKQSNYSDDNNNKSYKSVFIPLAGQKTCLFLTEILLLFTVFFRPNLLVKKKLQFLHTGIFQVIYMPTLIWVASVLQSNFTEVRTLRHAVNILPAAVRVFSKDTFLSRRGGERNLSGWSRDRNRVSVASRWHWANDTEQTWLPQCISCPQISILHLTSHGWLPIEGSSGSFHPFVISGSSAGADTHTHTHTHTNRYTVLAPQALVSTAQFKLSTCSSKIWDK